MAAFDDGAAGDAVALRSLGVPQPLADNHEQVPLREASSPRLVQPGAAGFKPG